MPGSTALMPMKTLRALAHLYEIPDISTAPRQHLIDLLTPLLEGE